MRANFVRSHPLPRVAESRALVVATLLVTVSLLVAVPTSIAAAPRGTGVDVYGPTITIDTWSRALSPYRIHANITVVSTGTLDIEDGVEVLFDANTALTVDGGNLHINGIATNRVLFNANTSTPSPGYYGFIRINGSTPTLTASYADFHYGIKGFYIEGNGSAQTMQITDCNFSNNQEAGIYASNVVGMTIFGCRFNDSQGYGLHLDASSNCTIGNTNFTKNSWSNIELVDSQFISVQSCNMDLSPESMFISGSSGVLVTASNLINSPLAVKMTGSYNSSFIGNHFLNDSLGMVLIDSHDNYFRDNTFTTCGEGITFEGGTNFLGNDINVSNTFSGVPIVLVNTSTTLDSVTAGELLLVGLENATIRNVTLPVGGHIQVFRCNNIELSNIALEAPARGIVVENSFKINATDYSVRNATASGVQVLGSTMVNLTNGTVWGCVKGVFAADTSKLYLNWTDFYNNMQDLVCSNSSVETLDSHATVMEVPDDSNLSEKFTLVVEVRDEANAPMPGVHVNVTQPTLNQTIYATSHYNGTSPLTGANGRTPEMIVTSYVRGSGLASVHETDMEVWDGSHSFLGTPNATILVSTFEVFTAQAAGSLAGNVKNQTGVAIAGATVTLNSGINITTNSSGGYLFQILAPGLYDINVSAPGYNCATASGVRVTGGNTTVRDFVLTPLVAPPGRVEGTVRDSSGASLQGVNVSIPSLGIGAVTDIAGNFSIKNVTAGDQVISALKAGYDSWNGNILVTSGQVTKLSITLNVTATANQTGSISGTVRNAQGLPISGANITIIGTNKSAPSGSNGSYTLSNITAGRYDLMATCPGFADSSVPNVTVTAGNDTKLDITLTRTNIFVNQSLGVTCTVRFKDNGTLDIIDAGAKDRPLRGAVGLFFRVEKSNASKIEWINITVKYTRGMLPAGMNESDLRLYYYDRDIKIWKVCEESGVDTARGVVWGNITHLTLFGLGGGTGPKSEGVTIALPGFMTPLAFVAVVLIVGVPIGILVIRIRTPPPARKPAMPQSRQEEPEEPF